MEHSEDAAINDWGRTLRRWQEYILNYFDHYTANAYTEGVHTKMKLMKRKSCGFKNVDVYIKKASLFCPPYLHLLPHFLRMSPMALDISLCHDLYFLRTAKGKNED